jgi:hypothetical protein
VLRFLLLILLHLIVFCFRGSAFDALIANLRITARPTGRRSHMLAPNIGAPLDNLLLSALPRAAFGLLTPTSKTDHS